MAKALTPNRDEVTSQEERVQRSVKTVREIHDPTVRTPKISIHEI